MFNLMDFAAGPSMTSLEESYVLDAMKNWYGKDAYKYCEMFQKQFADYHGRKYGVMTTNCTSAIHLALIAAGVRPGDEVIVPELTWTATAEPIVWLGAKPVFCDVEYRSWCISPRSIINKITRKTKAIIAVDLYGNMPDFNEIVDICNDYHLSLIEDSAEALGSKYMGRLAGTFGESSVFSFHRTKTLVCGEGGILLTDDKKIYDCAMYFRDHCRDKNRMYYNLNIGYKYMPFNVQAAIAYGQLQRIDELISIKRRHLDLYRTRLEKIGMLNIDNDNVYNGAWITCFMPEKRLYKETVAETAAKFNIPIRPFYYPLSSLPAYGEFANKCKLNESSYYYSQYGINLPGAMILSDDMIMYICDILEKCYD
jgi:perosamine synthetase